MRLFSVCDLTEMDVLEILFSVRYDAITVDVLVSFVSFSSRDASRRVC